MARRIAVIIYPGFQPLDAVGPLEVFAAAGRVVEAAGRPAPYRIELVAPEAGEQRGASGYGLMAPKGLAGLRGPIDTLIVAGGDGARQARHDLRLRRFLQRRGPQVRRLCSVCTGAFILAEAGLLDGRRATTHWATCEHLRARYAAVKVEVDPIFVKDGPVYTSAGVTAGIDLALSLVEEDLGAEVARTVARWLVVFLQRPGGQRQFSAQLRQDVPDNPDLRELQQFIAEHPEADLSVPSLARRVAMSSRHFARRFRAELGITPGRYVCQVRVEHACRHLERGRSVQQVAERCGFGTEESMRRAFMRVLGVPPRRYRQHFGLGGAA